MSATTYWAVMKAYDFRAMSVFGICLTAPKEGPHRFIPVFDTKEQAIAFEDGCKDHVYMLTINKASGSAKMGGDE